MITGEALRSARDQASMTQRELADRMAVSERTIGNWERGEVVPQKYWRSLGEVFPGLGEREAQVEGLAAAMHNSRLRSWELARSGKGLEAADWHREVHVGVDGAITAAESALKLGADPRLAEDLAAAAIELYLNAGTLSVMMSVENNDAAADLVRRSGEVLRSIRREVEEAPVSPKPIPLLWHRHSSHVSGSGDTFDPSEMGDEDFTNVAFAANRDVSADSLDPDTV